MSPELIPWLAALLFIIGLIALVVEIFFVPGFGIAGVAGLLFMGWAVLLMVTDIAQATQALVIALISTIVLFFAGIKVATRLNMLNRISLGLRQNKDEGYSAPSSELANYLGLTGKVITPLRPSGTIVIEDTRLDVVSEGDFIAVGANVKVVNVEGSRVVVRQVYEE